MEEISFLFLMYDKKMAVEVLKDGDKYTIGEMTLNETLDLLELGILMNFCITKAKSMTDVKSLTDVKFCFYHQENTVYSITISLTDVSSKEQQQVI